MPWDGTELWVAELAADGRRATARVAGGRRVDLPAGMVAGRRAVLRVRPDRLVEPLSLERDAAWRAHCPMEAEFGAPQWVFGMSTMSSSPTAGSSARTRGRLEHLALDRDRRAAQALDVPYTRVRSAVRERSDAYSWPASPTEPLLVRLDLGDGTYEVLRRRRDGRRPRLHLGAEPIEFPTDERHDGARLLLSASEPDFVGPAGERPPLIVISHGGPTRRPRAASASRSSTGRAAASRVVDVNYGGSTGYGRAYRERLTGNGASWTWTTASRGALPGRAGEVDGDGWRSAAAARAATRRCALTFHDVFAPGASYYGIGRPARRWRSDTHKFESRYLDRLVGPYPEARDLYRERSPIHFTERLACPMILFQGLEDKVVPPAQAEMMVEALRAKGAGRLPGLRGRAARLPARPRHQARAGSGAVFLLAYIWLRSGGGDRAGADRDLHRNVSTARL